MKRIAKLLQDYRRYQNKADSLLQEIENECQPHSELPLNIFYQPSDGLCFSIDRVRTAGITMNVALTDFRKAIKNNDLLDEEDLNDIAI